jgi:hypothetical protein
MCTGQEAVDEIVRVRANEFSRIQARFKTRLSLTSSSVDEVVQERILKKTPEAKNTLEELYNEKDSVLRNLIQFQEARKDLVGFNSPGEFAKNFPFVPYQFTIMQTVFNEIRKHGNAGKHQSNGERSMLSGFQEATQAIEERDEYALVPFYRFYDTVHTFLDGAIRRVIERCEKQAEKGQGIEPQDVDVLKLLYLVRYVDDIPKNVENLMILMADRIDADKILLRKQVQESLDRLLGQNYIGRSGDTYHFLTDEEQDIQREIRNTNVDTYSIVEQISKMIFADIYTTKKFRYGRYDFDFNKMVDGVVSGSLTEGMKLRFLTVATDPIEKTELRLMTQSKGEAIVVLPDSRYYENLESAMKVTKYVKQRNVAQMPKSVQDIIGNHQKEAELYEADAKEQLKKAIEDATYYVDGERVEIKGGDAKAHIDAALEYLVGHVYSDLDLITKNVDTDAEILAILSGEETTLDGMEPNRDAAAKVEEHLTMQDRMKLPTSMSDIQSRYSGVPYGWREIDIAAVVALLIYQQKVTIKYGGATIRPDDPKLPDLLRKRSEVGKTTISIHHTVTAANMKAIRELLREYFEVMDVPNDEMNLVKFILDRFTAQKSHLEELNQKYTGRRNYPDHDKVTAAIALVQDILSQQKDNIALISRVLKREDDLFDSKEDLQNVEGFFRNQVQIFDAAAQMEEDFRNDLDYLSHEPEANAALNQIRLITQVKGGFSYRKIPELNGLMTTVTEGHERLLEAKREELTDLIYQCVAAVHQASGGNYKAHEIVSKADTYYEQKKQNIKTLKTLALLDGLIPQMLQYKDATCGSIEVVLTPPKPVSTPKPAGGNTPPAPKKIIKPCQRAIVFPAKTLESEADIDTYVEQLRQQLKTMLRGCDGLQIK